MIRLLVGALLSAVVLFAWGYYFWGVSGLPNRFLLRLPDEDGVAQALRKADPDSGRYQIPYQDPAAVSGADKDKQADLVAHDAKGPIVEILYRKEGFDLADPQNYVVGFCHFFAASLLAGVLLVMAQPGLTRYWARVLFVALAGAFATVAVSFAGPVWFHHPWLAVLYVSGYQVVGWLLAGLVLGLAIRPAKAAAEKN